MTATGATRSGSGSAGRRGEKIRSDVWAAVEPRRSGGIEIELESRVEPYYGDAIRNQIRGVLTALGLEHATVEVRDSGALPFVIAARVEAAARKAVPELAGDARPEAIVSQPAASARDRLRRSRLYLPGNEPKYFLNAGSYGPDGVILDLEDSVHADAKDDARLLVRNALRCINFKGAERMVRINQLPLGLTDLQAIVPEAPEMILVPKVESAGEVREVEQAIDRVMAACGIERPPWLMPILETARGIEQAFEIAQAGQRVAAVTIGLEDYAADMGVPRTSEGDESPWARARLANAARAADVQAIDSVYGQVDDLDGLRQWCERSRRLGFQGMGCLHPRQIEVIHEAFNPTASQIERALRIVDAFEKAQAEGLGVVSLGSKMIDPPVVKQAQRLVRQARVSGLIPQQQD
jgi:citrate lyase subunit beta/citryl-CoA lyase